MKRRGKKKLTSVGNSSSSILSGAIKDLNNEMASLSREKLTHKKMLNDVSAAIEMNRKKERELQSKIAKLIDREAQLSQKKKKLQSKVDKVSDTMGKISKIKSEMVDV